MSSPGDAPGSLQHLIDTVTALQERGVGFRSVTEAIDTTTAGGRLVFPCSGRSRSSSGN